MVAKKRKSKRQTLQQKYKIIKRTKEHKKRLKKGAILNTRNSKLSDTGIPSQWPYKEELLKEVQRAKDKMEEARVRQKEKRNELLMSKRLGGKQVESLILSGNTDHVHDMEIAPESTDATIDESFRNLGQNSRRAYLRELRKVIESADVILHVLDARDPIGTKSTAVEEMVKGNYRKKLVYVLNKADLVPKEVLANWLLFLRQTNPVIPFKSNTQNQKSNLGHAKGKVAKENTSLQTNQAVGIEELIGLLKNYSRSGEGKSSICVGVVGYPNVGKSSLINSLMRTRVAGVSSMPGFTRSMQEVILDKTIRLLDSPGIVFADGDSTATALRNCVCVEEMTDLLTPIQAILDRCPSQYLMQLYNIPRFSDGDCMGFLALVARSTGKLKKGGIPNTDMAARSIIHDWNDGKIKYYCIPPSVAATDHASRRASEESSALHAKIVDSFSEELNIDDLARGVLGALESHRRGVDENIYVGVRDMGSQFADIIDDNQIAAPAIASQTLTKRSTSRVAKKQGNSLNLSKQPSGVEMPYDFDSDFKYTK